MTKTNGTNWRLSYKTMRQKVQIQYDYKIIAIS